MNDQEFFPLVSVIIPVYNVEEYLERCVYSVTNQTYSNLEIILVDDGSTDSSGSLCDALQKTDSRIMTIHSENHGLSAARNLGMESMHGSWIVYVDSDDYIGPNHVLNLLSTAIGSNCTMAVTGVAVDFEDEKRSEIKKRTPTEYAVYNASEAICIAIESVRLPFAEHAQGKIYSSSLAPFLFFPEGKKFEDQFVAYRVMYEAGLIAYENANDYYYLVDRSASITNTRDQHYLDTLEARRQILRFSQEKNLTDIEKTATKKYFARLIGCFADLLLCGEQMLADQLYRTIALERSSAIFSPFISLTTKFAMILSYLPKNVFAIILRANEMVSSQKSKAIRYKEFKASQN